MRSSGNAGSGALVVPSAGDRDTARRAGGGDHYGGDESQACALPASYRLAPYAELARGRRGNSTPTRCRPKAPSRFWARLRCAALLRPTPSRRRAVEAPHPIFDEDTEHQAADLFLQTGAAPNSCSPAPTAVPTPTRAAATAPPPPAAPGEDYRISDAAHGRCGCPVTRAVHDPRSPRPTAQLAFLQLHGNAEPCPAALVSNGSGSWSDTDFAGQLGAQLIARSVAVGKCGDGYPTATCDLCGTDNVEARFTAASPDACTQMGSSYGRMVHAVEQQLGLAPEPINRSSIRRGGGFPVEVMDLIRFLDCEYSGDDALRALLQSGADPATRASAASLKRRCMHAAAMSASEILLEHGARSEREKRRRQDQVRCMPRGAASTTWRAACSVRMTRIRDHRRRSAGDRARRRPARRSARDCRRESAGDELEAMMSRSVRILRCRGRRLSRSRPGRSPIARRRDPADRQVARVGVGHCVAKTQR